jgi:hypothetical protein
MDHTLRTAAPQGNYGLILTSAERIGNSKAIFGSAFKK